MSEHIHNLSERISKSSVSRLFGIPGSGVSLKLLDSLEKYDIDFCLTHFEATAAIIAGTIGRLSGVPGISLSIKGPGLTNQIPGLALCHFEDFPMISISESYSPEDSCLKAHKRIDHSLLVESVTHNSFYSDLSGEAFEKSFQQALVEAPGPVLLNLTNAPVDEKNQKNSCGKPEKLKISTEVFHKSQKPVIIAGGFANRLNLHQALNSLNIPVFSTAAAKGVVDETHSHAAGVYTGVGKELSPEASIIPMADLVIGIGLRPKEVLSAKSFQCETILFDAGVGHQAGAFGVDLSYDPEQLNEVISILSGKNWGIEETELAKEKMRKHLLAVDFLPATAYDIISRTFDHACVVMDTGYFCTIGEHVYQAKSCKHCLLSGQARYMGSSVPMGLGASMYDLRNPTIVTCGDGGVGPFIAEVKLAVRYKLPLCFILFTDGGFASIADSAVKNGMTTKPLQVDRQSWVPVLEAMGIPGKRLESASKFSDSLSRWKPSEGPVFLEVVFPQEEYRNMTNKLR